MPFVESRWASAIRRPRDTGTNWPFLTAVHLKSHSENSSSSLAVSASSLTGDKAAIGLRAARPPDGDDDLAASRAFAMALLYPGGGRQSSFFLFPLWSFIILLNAVHSGRLCLSEPQWKHLLPQSIHRLGLLDLAPGERPRAPLPVLGGGLVPLLGLGGGATALTLTALTS